MRMIGVLMLGIVLGGCQPLPHPFERDGVAPAAEALDLPGAAGVAIAPVTGLPGDAGTQLAIRMAAALDDLDIPASVTGGNRASLKLTGRAQGNDVVWTLSSPTHAPLGSETESGAVPASEWAAGTGATLDRLTNEAASRLARLITGPDASADTSVHDSIHPAGRAAIVLRVEAPPAAPGDGREALTAALRHALVDNGYKLSDKDAAVIVRGEVVLTSVGPRQHIRIVWHVLRKDGTQQAELAQENDIAPGSLDHAWGPIAGDIAAAAMPDLSPQIEAAAGAP